MSRTEGYAQAIVEIAEAEERLDTVPDELFAIGQAVGTNADLRRTLSDQNIPAQRRIGIVEDLLAGRASPLTLNLVAMLVGAGRGGDVGEVAEAVLAAAAARRGQSVAVVRSVVPLDDDQKRRLTEALTRASGREVTINVVIDPEVMGGLSAQVGDMVFDGTVRTRLDKLKERLA